METIAVDTVENFKRMTLDRPTSGKGEHEEWQEESTWKWFIHRQESLKHC